MREEKKLFLNEIKEKIEESNSMVVTQYTGLKPVDSWSLSKELFDSDSSFMVLKKRLFDKACKDCKISFEDNFIGHVGVVFIKGDYLKAVKSLVKYKEENKDLLKIVTGKIEKDICSLEEITTLSKLPDKNTMRGMFLSVLEAPMSCTLSAVNNLLLSVIYCIENKNKNEKEV